MSDLNYFTCDCCGVDVYGANRSNYGTEVYYTLCYDCFRRLEEETPLPAPTLEATPTGRFVWNAVEGATEYCIRYGYGSGNLTRQKIVGQEITSFAPEKPDHQRLKNLAVFCRVAAVSATGRVGDWSVLRASGVDTPKSLLSSSYSGHFYGHLYSVTGVRKIHLSGRFGAESYMTVLNGSSDDMICFNPYYVIRIQNGNANDFTKVEVVELCHRTVSCPDVVKMLINNFPESDVWSALAFHKYGENGVNTKTRRICKREFYREVSK